MTIPVDPLAPLGSTARTTPLRIRPQMLPGAALLAILLIGLLSSLYTLAVKHDELPARDVSWPALAKGDMTSAVSHLVQKSNPLEDPLVTFDRVVAWITVGDLGARVRRGCDNWLFLTDELALHPSRAANASRRVRMVEEVAAFLKSRNVRLMVAPVPDKSRVEAAALCGVDRPAALDGRLADFSTRLREGGVDTVDLLGPMRAVRGERYYRTDTHWNEKGAKAAADAIAAALHEANMAPTQKAEFRVASEGSR